MINIDFIIFIKFEFKKKFIDRVYFKVFLFKKDVVK